MDRDQFFQLNRDLWPVVATILSVILNIISFFIGIGWDSNTTCIIGAIAILGTAILSGLVIFTLYRITRSSYIEEYTILESIDEYNILDPNNATYRKIIKIKVNKPTPVILIDPPTTDGKVQDYQAFQKNNSMTKYDIHLQRISGRELLILNIGRPLVKREILEGICIECKLINSFQGEKEGVSVSTDPGQKKCQVTITLPHSLPPLSRQAEWYVVSGRNPSPRYSGTVRALRDDSSFVFTKDFSPELGDGIGRQCWINWRWASSKTLSQTLTKNDSSAS